MSNEKMSLSIFEYFVKILLIIKSKIECLLKKNSYEII